MNKTVKVSIYSTRQCPNCRQAKAFLQKNKVRFVEFDIERNQRAFKDFQRMGARGVPVITIGDLRVDGFDNKKLMQALKSKNLLS